MSGRVRLGLTRNRLFSFDSCVGFLAEIDGAFDIAGCNKALKTLSLKEPVLNCGVELEEDAQAYLVEGKYTLSFEEIQGDAQEYFYKRIQGGMDFSGELFSFVVLNGNTLGIFAHTVMADVRSLMYLAGEFIKLYNSKTLSVTPCEIKVLSDKTQLPSNVFSVVVDRLASDLEFGWRKNPKSFTMADYKKACEKHFANTDSIGTLVVDVDEQTLAALKEFAVREGVDVSSVVAFAFYESLTGELGGPRRYRKLNVQGNERVFFEDYNKMRVGAYNGYVTVEKKKNKNVPDTFENNAINFHKEIYKRVTSSFSVFYNEFIFMHLSESFADSQYVYCAGELEHKFSKKLACTYGCAKEVVGEFCSYNLNQACWSALSSFKNVMVSEPLKMRSSSLITFIENGGKGKAYFSYKKGEISDSAARNVTKNVEKYLEKFK